MQTVDASALKHEPIRQVFVFTGGRDFRNSEVVETALKDLGFLDRADVVGIVGDATGADAEVRRLCTEYGKNHLVIPADWDEHGRAAGPKRNRLMMKVAASFGVAVTLVAFPGGAGTANAIQAAFAAGFQCVVLDSRGELSRTALTILTFGGVACSVCGASRLVSPEGRPTACSFTGCPAPLADYEKENR